LRRIKKTLRRIEKTLKRIEKILKKTKKALKKMTLSPLSVVMSTSLKQNANARFKRSSSPYY
jgi:hypothetical protein